MIWRSVAGPPLVDLPGLRCRSLDPGSLRDCQALEGTLVLGKPHDGEKLPSLATSMLRMI